MNKDKTAIMVVLDRSGSMGYVSKSVKEGFDAFVAEQRKLPGIATLTLVQFDDVYEVVYLNKPLEEVPALVHEPRGGTALLDALGRGVLELEADIAKLAEASRPARVLVLVMTDGAENSSKEFNHARVLELVGAKRAAGWEFAFIGANIDAFAAGNVLGFAHAQQFDASAKGVRSAYQVVNSSVANYRSGGGYKP